MVNYLLRSFIWRGNEAVSLTDNGRVFVAANCIHFPMCIVIVYHMDRTKSAPWHPLDQSLTKVVECNCDLHLGVHHIIVVCPKQHHLRQRKLVLAKISKVKVGNSDAG